MTGHLVLSETASSHFSRAVTPTTIFLFLLRLILPLFLFSTHCWVWFFPTTPLVGGFSATLLYFPHAFFSSTLCCGVVFRLLGWLGFQVVLLCCGFFLCFAWFVFQVVWFSLVWFSLVWGGRKLGDWGDKVVSRKSGNPLFLIEDYYYSCHSSKPLFFKSLTLHDSYVEVRF